MKSIAWRTSLKVNFRLCQRRQASARGGIQRTSEGEGARATNSFGHPHVDVTCHVSTVQDLLLRADDPLAKVDLVVSALGDWPAESLLDDWQAAQKHRVPIVYGWTEPHAAAGHAVVISSANDRLRSGLDDYGTPYLIAVRWPDETRRYEPACSAAFDPYGPVELGFVNSMVAQVALDVVLGQVQSGTHRIWLARRAFVNSIGGAWSENYAQSHQMRLRAPPSSNNDGGATPRVSPRDLL